MELETGKFYWFRHKVEQVWRVCYVGQDPDDNQWLFIVGQEYAVPVYTPVYAMRLEDFEWTAISPPE